MVAYSIAWLLLAVPTSSSFLKLPSCPVHTPLQHKIRRPKDLFLFALPPSNHNSADNDQKERPFRETLLDLGLPERSVDKTLAQLVAVGLLDHAVNGTPETLIMIAQDFLERPEVFSALLMSDFSLPPLVAHQVRAGVMGVLLASQPAEVETKQETAPSGESRKSSQAATHKNHTEVDSKAIKLDNKITENSEANDFIKVNGVEKEVEESDLQDEEIEVVKRPLYKSVIVNVKASKRRSASKKDDKSTDKISGQHEYGLPSDYETKYPKLAGELEAFYSFMTRPSTGSQEDSIRPATASVYMRHAKQFLGWYAVTHNKDQLQQKESGNDSSQLSLYAIFPDKEKKSADAVLEFILWLRSSRDISTSYEANILRGLTKVLKFRFAQISQSDPSYGEKSFDDIPLIREIRKLHRDANKRQSVAPRSSDESQKWLTWPEYLQVVKQTQTELVGLLNEYKVNDGSRPPRQKEGKDGKVAYTPMQRKISTCYQRYLILAIFSSVPDRQRTIRELEIGRSFQKEEGSGCWCIKHAPEDYKTGKAYGERPLLQLSKHLTPWIDEFLEDWRQCLVPKSKALFAQPRTGKPLTADSVYQIVGRACYNCTGKRTNPHLLRDMLVTHVRESDASEKQLEALALYMGHSIQMQRSSYDRRTLSKKVAPAVELMQSVNGQTGGE